MRWMSVRGGVVSGTRGTCPECGAKRYVRDNTQAYIRCRQCVDGATLGKPFLDTRGYALQSIADDDPLISMLSYRRKKGGVAVVAQHRLVMARFLGRPLTNVETVHHINGNRTDNRIENLQLRHEHHGAGHSHRCLDCGSTNVVSEAIHD